MPNVHARFGVSTCDVDQACACNWLITNHTTSTCSCTRLPNYATTASTHERHGVSERGVWGRAVCQGRGKTWMFSAGATHGWARSVPGRQPCHAHLAPATPQPVHELTLTSSRSARRRG